MQLLLLNVVGSCDGEFVPVQITIPINFKLVDRYNIGSARTHQYYTYVVESENQIKEINCSHLHL